MSSHPPALTFSGDLPDWGYDLPSNIDPTIPPLKKVLLAHLVAGIILGLYWFFSLVITLVARSKKKKSEKWSLREWQLLYYQSKTLFLLIPPFLVTAAMFSLDMAYLTVAMQTLNERLPKGTPPILTLGPYGVWVSMMSQANDQTHFRRSRLVRHLGIVDLCHCLLFPRCGLERGQHVPAQKT